MMTKQQRDVRRKRLQAERDKFDDMIISGFAKVYPTKNMERMQVYQMMLDFSKSSFNEFTNGHNSRYTQSSAFVRADPRNMSKTNPQPIKGKAQDLINHQQQQQSPNKAQATPN